MAPHTPVHALTGIRVLDLSGTLAGSITAMLLGDYGAEVVHVDPPSRHRMPRLLGEAIWHRNKTCSTLDWTSAADVATLHTLLQGTDIVITTEADIDKELGIDTTTESGLIHLSMPTRVPLTAGGPEIDAFLWATSGLAARQPSFDGDPVESVYPFVLYTQGAWGATAAVAALFERETSGLGQQIVVDGLHGALLAGTAVYVADPTTEPMSTAGGPNRYLMTAPYRCADNEWLFFIALGRFVPTVFRAIGLAHVLDDPRVGGTPTNLLTSENQSWVRQTLTETFASQPRDHWLHVLAEAGCPAGAVNSRDDWLDHPQVVSLDQRKTLHDPIDGEVVTSGALVDLQATPARDPQPRSIVTSSSLPQWAARPARAQPTSREDRNGPLEGIRVLNTGLFIAGPFGGMLLAELGADVIKVEKLTGNNIRDGSFHYIRGQRSLAIDLHHERGHTMFLDLVAGADVVMDNFRPGVLERLGLDHASLSAVKPNIVTASITSFGEVGPHAGEPGMDPLIQALSGIMAAQGGDSEPVNFAIGPTDILGGLAAAFGVCLALFHRARGGDGQRVQTSLVSASLFLQSGELFRAAGRLPASVGGRDYKGPSAVDRIYATADGHIRIHASDPAALVRAGLLSDESLSDDAATKEIQHGLSAMTRKDAAAALTAAGIAAVPARLINEFVLEDQSAGCRYFAALESIDDVTLYLPNRLARFSRTELRTVLRTAGIGEHSREVLAEAGIADDAIDGAVESGIVKLGHPVLWFSAAAGQW